MKGMRETDTHIYFWGSIYSQWHKRRFQDEEGVYYDWAEQYMMAGKAELFNDEESFKAIIEATHPADHQMIGRRVKNFDPTIWDKEKFKIVVDGNYYKFSQNEELKQKLLTTGDRIIVEGSPTDQIWGVGLHFNDHKIEDEKNWDGGNLLGKAIMEARERIKGEQK